MCSKSESEWSLGSLVHFQPGIMTVPPFQMYCLSWAHSPRLSFAVRFGSTRTTARGLRDGIEGIASAAASLLMKTKDRGARALSSASRFPSSSYRTVSET